MKIDKEKITYIYLLGIEKALIRIAEAIEEERGKNE